MAQADVLTPAGEVGTRQGTFPNTGAREVPGTSAAGLRTRNADRLRSCSPRSRFLIHHLATAS
jgi:hypothetical protein